LCGVGLTKSFIFNIVWNGTGATHPYWYAMPLVQHTRIGTQCLDNGKSLGARATGEAKTFCNHRTHIFSEQVWHRRSSCANTPDNFDKLRNFEGLKI
jgi:hypothetical protein